MFGERCLSKKEMVQLENMESRNFREDNSRELRLQLKEESKSVYGWSSLFCPWTTTQTPTTDGFDLFPTRGPDAPTTISGFAPSAKQIYLLGIPISSRKVSCGTAS